MTQHVQILVGPVASGKSTYSRNAAQRGMVIVNDDAIVMAIHAGHYQLYDQSAKPLYKAVENTILQTAVALGRSVVVDRGTNNRPDSRRRWIGLAHSLDLPVVAVVFPDEGPEVHARRRFESDGRGASYEEWLKVAQHHADVGEPVNFYSDEGFDEVVTVQWPDVQNGWCYQAEVLERITGGPYG
jgi:predicted kinase